MIAQPLLAFEQRAKRDGDLQVLIALVSRRKCPRIAQDIAPQFGQFIEAVETLDAGTLTARALNGTYVTRATDGIAATYPTQSPGDAGAEPSCASGSRAADPYGSLSKIIMAVATPPFGAKLKSRLKLPERSANT